MQKLFLLLLLIIITSCSESPPGAGTIRMAKEDGMDLVYIPAGEFNMGIDANDLSVDVDESPAHMIYLDSYWIDKTEVTNAMFVQCISEGACKPPAQTKFFDNNVYADHPAIGVSWEQANVYCGWAGRRLPTEAEWEKAARGTDGRIYPWGNEVPTIELANFDQTVRETTPVGRYPEGASFYGALDMAGNAWEWVADGYTPEFYITSPFENPMSESPVNRRVLRGGNWDSNAEGIRATNRFWAFPGRNDTDGFRCADSD